MNETKLRTLPLLLPGRIIENQNSDFVNLLSSMRFYKANEVRILIFDDPAQQEERQRPGSGFCLACVLLFFPRYYGTYISNVLVFVFCV